MTTPKNYILLNFTHHIINRDSEGNLLFADRVDVHLLIPPHLQCDLATAVTEGSTLWEFVKDDNFLHYDDETSLPYTVVDVVNGIVLQHLVNSETVKFS